MRQTLKGNFDFQSSVGPRIMQGARKDRLRDAEFRHRVAAWKPVVKTVAEEHLRVAIVGRMNSGKSSIWNMFLTDPLTQKQMVLDLEGVTRDCVEALGKVGDMFVTMIDTPGAFSQTLVEEAQRTVQTADIVIFVTSIDQEVTPDELAVVKLLHRRNLPTVLVVNKMDLVLPLGEEAIARAEELLVSYQSLGLGKAIPFSVFRREGIDILQRALRPFYDISLMERTVSDWNLEDLAETGDPKAMERIRERNIDTKYIRVAIIGRPNCGKSTLFNRLLGYERSRAEEKMGTTRDAIQVPCLYNGRRLKLIDTAGLLKMCYSRNSPERQEYWKVTKRVIDFAHVVIVCFDAREGVPSSTDMMLCHTAVDEGRPFVLAANKWDSVADPAATAEAIDFRLKKQVHEVRYASAVVTSGQTGLNLEVLLDEAVQLHDRWSKQIHEGHVERFWKRFERTVSIPSKVTRILRVKQINTRPPAFQVLLQTKNPAEVLTGAYEAMVRNALIEEFELHGVPIRIIQEPKTAHPDYI